MYKGESMFDYQYFKNELKDIKENFDVIRRSL